MDSSRLKSGEDPKELRGGKVVSFLCGVPLRLGLTWHHLQSQVSGGLVPYQEDNEGRLKIPCQEKERK